VVKLSYRFWKKNYCRWQGNNWFDGKVEPELPEPALGKRRKGWGGYAILNRACTHEIAIGDSDLINVRFDPLCGLKSDISRGSEKCHNRL
jgi:hypothetical protein